MLRAVESKNGIDLANQSQFIHSVLAWRARFEYCLGNQLDLLG